MKRFTLLLMSFLLFSISLDAQIYGNTDHDNNGDGNAWLNGGYIIWWRILTGPSDSGSFTHYGFNVEDTNEATAVDVALYSHDVDADLPLNILDEISFIPVSGNYMQLPLSSTVTLEPDTYYWLATKPNDKFHTGRLVSENWDYPIYFQTHNYNDPFPDPVPNDVSSFTPNKHVVFMVANNTTLPIVLDAFNAEGQDDQVKLSWTTSEELNNMGWNIQRSTNGYTWYDIGFTEGQGYTSTLEDYEFIDERPVTGNNYYRLEQVDFDDTRSYSEIVNVLFKREEKTLSMFPNPFKDFIQVSDTDIEKYQIKNVSGSVIQSGVLANNQIETRDLSPGIYLVEVLKDGVWTSLKMVK